MGTWRVFVHKYIVEEKKVCMFKQAQYETKVFERATALHGRSIGMTHQIDDNCDYKVSSDERACNAANNYDSIGLGTRPQSVTVVANSMDNYFEFFLSIFTCIRTFLLEHHLICNQRCLDNKKREDSSTYVYVQC